MLGTRCKRCLYARKTFLVAADNVWGTRGLHGYSHENPVAITLEQQHAILDKTYKQLTEFCGKPPRGNVAPWWESSKEMSELMMRYGVEYGMCPLR